jgi:oligopeptidase A
VNHNPLLHFETLPDFAAIGPEHVTQALDELLQAANVALTHAVSDAVACDYGALSLALDVPVERLRRSWSAVNHLQSVCDTPALRAAYSENLPRVTEFYTRLGADDKLYAKYKAVMAHAGSARLTTAQRKALADALRDFVLGGAELQGAARERFAQIQERMAALSQQFGEHVLDATDAFVLYVDKDQLDGVPADLCAAARAAAAADGQEGYKLTLQLPCYRPLLQFARNRALRERLYTAYAQRASEFGPPALDNTALIEELVALRQEEAQLLGHGSYAELSLVPKMAKSPAEVLAFLRDLAQRARPHGQRDLAALRSFAERELGLAELKAWDLPFASEQMRQAQYAFSSDEVKRYFTEPRVLQGLFHLIETLFDVTIVQAPAPVWHDSVRHYRVERGGRLIGAFYLDLFARAGKQSGAWMDEAQQRWRRPDSGALQLPIAHLVCNFAAPVGEQPALLSHDDVITLFHEFGHGLHHMLTQVEEAAVSGIAGVEWDAAELPSQFMENFCWEWQVIERLTAHVDTGEPLPRALFDRMLAARNFHSGWHMLRLCENSLFDMRLHHERGSHSRFQQLAREVSDEIAVLPPPTFLRQAHAFGHIFDGGYAAGYYGYAWAEVLSADAYEAFEEAGIFDAGTGRRYRESILETGGSRSAMENFTAFRGREPRLDALLRHQGMA